MKTRAVSLLISLALLFIWSASVYAVEHKKDINNATMEELLEVKGIGERKARAILDYIRENEGVNNMDELRNVKGIGEKTLEELKKKFEVKKIKKE